MLSADDARQARDAGVEAVIVSNHGGNALDGVPATLQLLPEIVGAVGHDLEVLIDGGIRRGSGTVKALALGAKAVLVGRSYIWGLAAGGEEGVAQALRLLRDGVSRTLRSPRLRLVGRARRLVRLVASLLALSTGLHMA